MLVQLFSPQDGPLRNSPGGRLASFVLLLTIVSAGCGTAPDLETSRRFQTAEETFAAAKSPEEFVQAASEYQEVLDGGFTSGSVYYNQGNAWMQAGQTGRAIASYRNAQRSIPRDPYLAANLRQALSSASRPVQERKSVMDILFFWQTSISYAEKAWIVTLLLGALLLIALAGQQFRHTKELRRLNYFVLPVLMLMAASLARDWVNIELTKHGAVVSETVARKGGAENYEPAFNQPLTDGTEFVVKSQQAGWVQIQVTGAGEGWVPERDCVIY